MSLQSNSKKEGIKFTGSPAFEFSVWKYSSENIEEAKHPTELVDQGFYTVNIGLKQRNLGCTLSEPMEKYILKSGKYSFEFNLSPLNK